MRHTECRSKKRLDLEFSLYLVACVGLVFFGAFFGASVLIQRASVHATMPQYGLVASFIGVVFCIFVLILFVFVSGWVQMRFFEPISRLIEISGREDAIELLQDFRVDSTDIELLRDLFSGLIREQKEKQQVIADLERHRSMSELARQVAHDIRSPLAALAVLEQDLGNLSEERRVMLRSAVNRIRDIGNNLLETRHEVTLPRNQVEGTGDDVASHQVVALLDELITEKRMLFRAKLYVEILLCPEADGYGLFAKVQPSEFKRVVSNLINNAVEALSDFGKVTVTLGGDEHSIRLAVSDSGKGIPSEIIPRLMKEGATHDKAGGCGLGLYHAQKMIKEWGGKIEIESSVGKGTIVRIDLPRSKSPDWFVSKLSFRKKTKVVVLDDDISIHQIWQNRIESIEGRRWGIEIVHCSAADDIRQFLASDAEAAGRATYLVDYELLGSRETGLDLIESCSIATQSILVTSRFDEHPVRARCEKLNVKLIPKGLAGFVPIEVIDLVPAIDAVLVDDDLLVHTSWRYAAKREQKRVECFGSGAAFEAIMNEYDRDTPVFVDSSLGDGVKGEEWSRKLHDAGFKKIYLATGYAKERFQETLPVWIQGIVGKEAPWGTQA